jgi:hypothetical protein
MDINASIIDQRLDGIVEANSALLPPGNDPQKQKSAAFVLLSAATALGLPLDEAAEYLTEGGGDAGVDVLYVGDVEDGEFQVTLFQGKYKHKDLSGTAHFPENGVKAAIQTIGTLFDPAKALDMNDRLKPRIEEVRSLIRDGYIPVVKMVLCINGDRWNDSAQKLIDAAGFSSSQVNWVHLNHNDIVRVLQNQKSVDDSLPLRGEAVIEDFNYRRVLIGKVAIQDIADLFNRHGDQVLERNIRRYLGMNRNRVNTAIHDTLVDDSRRKNFYFFNNGITMICRKFRHNALQGRDYQLKLEGIQIINGGQTCKTIQQTLSEPDLLRDFSETYVLLRLYELAEDDKEFVQDITYATNSQNPVDLRDLRANDEQQRRLELGMQDLGFNYRRKRDDTSVKSDELTSSVVAEAVLAVWRRKPFQAKFRRKELFGKLYEEVFDTLNSAQAILAALIFRMVENERKRPEQTNPPVFLPYASHYKAMLVGDYLLEAQGIALAEVSHQNYQALLDCLNAQFDEFQIKAQEQIADALAALYGEREISLQQLSATFRRGDLMQYLTPADDTGAAS